MNVSKLRPRHGLHLHLLRAVHLPAPGVWVVRHSASLLMLPLYNQEEIKNEGNEQKRYGNQP